MLVVGGSDGLTGAPSLSSRGGAARRSRDRHGLRSRLAQRRLRAAPPRGDDPAVPRRGRRDDARRRRTTILAAAERAGAVALGPGLGRTDGTRALVGCLLDRLDKPVVLDADGLWALAGHLDWVFSRDAPTVLTPHAGELAPAPGPVVRVGEREPARRRPDRGGRRRRRSCSSRASTRSSPRPGRGPVVVDLGNPGLATAGSGDVLTGVVAAFLAKGMDADVAAAAAAAACGVASRPGRRAPRRRGDDRERRRRGPLAGALAVRRSEITIDLGAMRGTPTASRGGRAPAELWAVVKADAYGHGAVDAAGAALRGGAAGALRRDRAGGRRAARELPGRADPRHEPAGRRRGGPRARRPSRGRAARRPEVPDGLDVHLKVDTGMGRWGMALEEALALPRDRVVGVMSHLATADEADETFVRAQIERFAVVAAAFPGVPAHLANSAGGASLPRGPLRRRALRASPSTGSPRSATTRPPTGSSRCSPGGATSRSCETLAPGESTGYGRRFVAETVTRIGLVPVGYADGFRRGPDRDGGPRRRDAPPRRRDDLDGLARRRAR